MLTPKTFAKIEIPDDPKLQKPAIEKLLKELERFLRMLRQDTANIETEVRAARGSEDTLNDRLTNGGI